MGFMLPSRETPADRARALMRQKENIEAELDAQASILKANSSTLNSPLIDADGFPRADIDLWAVRHARVRIIELRNDLEALRNSIMLALQEVYDPAVAPTEASASEAEITPSTSADCPQPFAKVNGVAPGSPAAAAGLLREDLVISFGGLTKASFPSSSLQPLAELVAARENRQLPVIVQRQAELVTLNFTPRSGWGGRGLLGCHIVPY